MSYKHFFQISSHFNKVMNTKTLTYPLFYLDSISMDLNNYYTIHYKGCQFYEKQDITLRNYDVIKNSNYLHKDELILSMYELKEFLENNKNINGNMYLYTGTIEVSIKKHLKSR